MRARVTVLSLCVCLSVCPLSTRRLEGLYCKLNTKISVKRFLSKVTAFFSDAKPAIASRYAVNLGDTGAAGCIPYKVLIAQKRGCPARPD